MHSPRDSSGAPTAESASQLVAVGSAIRVLANTAAMLPVDVFTGTGKNRQEALLPPVLQSPDGVSDLPMWLYQVVESAASRGIAVGVKESSTRGRPTRVQLVDPDGVSVRVKDGKKTWRLDGVERDDADVWSFIPYPKAGRLLGQSPIEHHARMLGLAVQSERYGGKFFTEDATPSAILSTDKRVEKEQAATIKERFMDAVRGKREPAVLGMGMTYQAVNVSPVDAELLSTMKWSEAECARIFGPGMAELLGYETGGSFTYTNRVDRQMDLLMFAIDPWLTRLEASLSRWLPRPQQVQFQRKAFWRTDNKSRFEAHQIGIQSGFETINEVRELEDMPPVAWGNEPPPGLFRKGNDNGH